MAERGSTPSDIDMSLADGNTRANDSNTSSDLSNPEAGARNAEVGRSACHLDCCQFFHRASLAGRANRLVQFRHSKRGHQVHLPNRIL